MNYQADPIITCTTKKLSLKCSYDDRAKAKIIPGYKWNRGTKFWDYPLDDDTFKALLAMFPSARVHSCVKDELDRRKNRYQDYGKVKDKVFKSRRLETPDLNLPLYDHQLMSYNYFKQMPYAIDFSECGAGKTATQIALMADQVRNENYHILIVCPKSIMTQVWKSDIETFLSREDRQLNIVVLDKDVRGCEQTLPHVKDKPGIYIINFEKTWRIPRLKKIRWDMVVIDESSKIKTSSSKQTKAILKLNANYKSIMTGTPTPNSLLELFSQIKFVDRDVFGTTQYGFRSKYFQADYLGFNWEPKSETPRKFKSILDNISMGWKKEDCVDLPPVTTRTLECEMTPIQYRTYLSMKQEAIAFINSQGYSANIALTKLLRLAQITSGFIQNTEGQDIQNFKDNPKLLLLLETLRTIPENRKVIIWAVFHNDIERIKDSLGDSAVTYYGKTKNKERDLNINKFLNDDSTRYFIAHPKSAGHGLNLSVANYCIYYSSDYSYEGYQQSVDRINRLSQKNKMTVYHLVCKNSVDNIIYKSLERKKTINEFIKDVNNAWGNK